MERVIKDIITDEMKLCDRATEIDIRTEAPLMRDIVSALKNTLTKKGIISLSAPAIGYDKRIFCIKFDEEIKTFINPIIVSAKGLQLSKETCTSIPGKTYLRPRNNDIDVMYQRPMGSSESRTLKGLAAIVYQHEMDHLDGLLLSDVGLEIDEQFEKATEEERQEVINAYLESLDIRQKELDKAIEEDPDAKQTADAIKFMEGVQKGEITLDRPSK